MDSTADQNQVHSHVTTTTVDSERALINKWTSSSDDDQDGDQDGRHQNTKQQDRVERNGKMVFRESEIQPKPLKKNVSISNMVEEYGFGRSFESVDFDELFANSGRYRPKLSEIAGYVGSTDEGISSSIDRDSADEEELPADDPGAEPRKQSSALKISRVDSVMEQTFRQILVNNFCRCDDTLFIFLHVLFGIVCIIAGVFGVMKCTFGSLNYFLFLEGLACVFIFPILIMNWARHIGGCVHENQKVGKGLFFLVVLILRMSTTTLGTILFLLYVEYLETETILCHFVQKTFLTVIIFGWSFLFFVIFLPFCWYGSVFLIAKLLYARQLANLDKKAMDSTDSFTVEKAIESPIS